MPRFVVLLHTMPDHSVRPTHWDFMLEGPDGLSTWALGAAPTPDQSLPATLLPVHREKYLDYEGAIDGDRGEVVRWDFGTFRWLSQLDTSLSVHLLGQQLRGQVWLKRQPRSSPDLLPDWEFTYHPSDES